MSSLDVAEALRSLSVSLSENPESAAARLHMLHKTLRDHLCVRSDGASAGATRLVKLWDEASVVEASEAHAENSVSLEIIRPHSSSAPVVLVRSGPARTPVAVLKYRSKLKKSLREVLNYALCSFFCSPSFQLAAPCICRESGDSPAHDVKGTSLHAAVQDVVSQQIGKNIPWVATVEEAQRFLPMSPGLERLAQGSARHGGALDLQTVCELRVADELPHEDLQTLLSSVDQAAFERLTVYCILTCQMDCAPGNLMLRVQGSHVQLVLIDSTLSLPKFAMEHLRLLPNGAPEHDVIAQPLRGYWYPVLLLMPHAEQPVSDATRQWLLHELSASFLRDALRTASSLLQASHVLSPGVQNGLIARAAAMRELLDKSPGASLQELAGAAIPAWQRERAAALRQPEFWAFSRIVHGDRLRYFWARLYWQAAQCMLWEHKATIVTASLAMGMATFWMIPRLRTRAFMWLR